jgi:hypothetical protein
MGTDTAITPPPPRRGGSRIFCPMVDVKLTETGTEGELVMCPLTWRNTRNDRRRYRQHWRRDHWAPFMSETNAMLKFITKAQYLGHAKIGAEVTVYK